MTKNIAQWKNEISLDGHRKELGALYGNASQAQKERYLSALEGFERHFGCGAAEIFSAPGRTELCGNHTDHQSGCVLAASVSLDMLAVVSRREDTAVDLFSEGFGRVTLDISSTEKRPGEEGSSASLVRGIAAAIEKRGIKPGGFNAYICSNVPKGSGLSSSAAFEILVGKVFSSIYCGDSIAPVDLALMGQYAENEYFGKPCGLMDQLSCALGGIAFMDFADRQKPLTEGLDFSFEKHGYSLCITDAGGSHGELTHEYAEITEEMCAVSRALGSEYLNRVDEKRFWDTLPQLRKTIPDRALLRAMHFFGENQRVKKQLAALKNGRMDTYIDLMRQSGRSSQELLQNIYPSSRSGERSVALALAISSKALDGEGASRVHGGGFAGTIQALVPEKTASSYIAAMERVFGDGSCKALAIRPVGAYQLK